MKCIRGADLKGTGKGKRENASEMAKPKRGAAPGDVNRVAGENDSLIGAKL